MAINGKRITAILRAYDGLPEEVRNASIVRDIERMLENPKSKNGDFRAQLVASAYEMFEIHRPGLKPVDRVREVAMRLRKESGLNPDLDNDALMKAFYRHWRRARA